jgi:putative SOS response-associated peptidase YedK
MWNRSASAFSAFRHGVVTVGYSEEAMCGRFARKPTQEILAEWFGLELEEMPWFAPTYNAAPQIIQPVIRLNRDSGRREAALLRWGLVPFWAKDAKIGYSTINARAEEAAAKPAYREALKKRRCLVPADAFYEWQRRDSKTKQPFAIALKSGEPYAFAGLWESWRPKDATNAAISFALFGLLASFRLRMSWT